MPAGKADIYIEQGTSWSAVITVLQADNSPFTLTGFTLSCQIRSTAVASTVLAIPMVTILDAANGVIKISLTPTQTLAIPTSGTAYSDVVNYVYDVNLMDTSGGIKRILNGYAKVSPGVTR